MRELKSKFIGCMIGCAVGDALGASLEGASLRSALKAGELKFSGRWTDDTHMMIGVAESLIANKGFNGEHMAWTFIKNWEREPWRGYGPGPPRVFRMIKSGIAWNEAAKRLYGGMGSFGNGAAMRVAPVGLLYYDDEDKLREIAYKSAEITHTHTLGVEGAALQAYAVALALKIDREHFNPPAFMDKLMAFTRVSAYKSKLEAAKALLNSDDRLEVIRKLGNHVEALNSVPTAIYSFAKNPQSYAETVLYAIGLGGDADTIGAMAGAIAGAHHGVKGIPSAWMENLERKDYITKLAEELWKIKVKGGKPSIIMA